MLNKARYGNKVDRAQELSTVALWRRIESSSSPRHLKPHLRAAAFGAGFAVKGFGMSLWRYERKRGLPAIREFVDLLPSYDYGFLPAHRVATWAVIKHYFAERPAEVLPRLIDQAVAGIGIENAHEEWVARYGRIDPAPDDARDLHAAFMFGTAERVVASVVTDTVTRDDVGGTQLIWPTYFATAMELYRAEAVDPSS